MSITCKALFAFPQTEIAGLLRDRLRGCLAASLVVGFATVDGLASIEEALLSPPMKMRVLVVGNGTQRAFDMMDRMLSLGVSPERLRIHLGHSRPSPSYGNNVNTFQWYRPMLHSKIYFCEMPDARAAVFVGCNNLTHYALNGLNGEASVLLEGPMSDHEIVSIRDHINAAVAQSVEYKPSMKEALTWWTTKFIDGLRLKVNDVKDDAETAATILALATTIASATPTRQEIVYFEMPAGLPQVKIGAAVHIFGLEALPSSPEVALATLHAARFKLRGTVVGVEKDTGAHEVDADWEISGAARTLRPTPQRRYRPPRGENTVQVRVQVEDRLKVYYEYLFREPKQKWLPDYDRSSVVKFPPDDLVTTRSEPNELLALNLDPPEDGEFMLVRGLEPMETAGKGKQEYLLALKRTSPESGSYVLFSQRRRKRPEFWLPQRKNDNEQ